MKIGLLVLCLLVFPIAACDAQAIATQTPIPPSPIPAHTIQAVNTIQTSTATIAAPQRLSCEDWQAWPETPLVTETARALYQRGQMNGNNPHAFSKIGDGEVSAAWFLSAFDLGAENYDLGVHQNLLPVIEHFASSFERISMAARRGFNTRRILDPSEADPTLCAAGESPLTCELLLHQPSFAILSLGTNQVWQPDEFEAGMRQILDVLVVQNVVPILSTKGDNLEGDHRINRTIACLAQEYDVPLWNFWSAIQPLPNHGLQPDLEHLTYGITDFDDEDAMQSAWTIRNLTALQTLDSIWRGVMAQQ